MPQSGFNPNNEGLAVQRGRQIFHPNHLFLRKYLEILSLCRIHKAVFHQFTSSPILLQAGPCTPSLPLWRAARTAGSSCGHEARVAAAAPGTCLRAPITAAPNGLQRRTKCCAQTLAVASTVPGSGHSRYPAAGVHSTRQQASMVPGARAGGAEPARGRDRVHIHTRFNSTSTQANGPPLQNTPRNSYLKLFLNNSTVIFCN